MSPIFGLREGCCGAAGLPCGATLAVFFVAGKASPKILTLIIALLYQPYAFTFQEIQKFFLYIPTERAHP